MANWKIIIPPGDELMYLDSNDGKGLKIQLSDNEPMRASYAAFTQSYIPYASPTDILTIQGSATKTIRIRTLSFAGTATASTNIFINSVRRSTANTGGASSVLVTPRRDLLNDMATATLKLWTSAPTGLGTVVDGGFSDGGRLNLAPAATGAIDRLLLQYSWINEQAPVLRGVNDFFCVNLALNPTTLTGVSWPSGGQLDVNIVWSEE
jgi:hypothetical protein